MGYLDEVPGLDHLDQLSPGDGSHRRASVLELVLSFSHAEGVNGHYKVPSGDHESGVRAAVAFPDVLSRGFLQRGHLERPVADAFSAAQRVTLTRIMESPRGRSSKFPTP